MKKDNKEKSPVNLGSFLIRLAAVMFCLLLVSMYLMSGLFARYVSRGQGGDSARVAKFNPSVIPMANNVNIEYGVTPKNQGAYTITVTNDSEVAVTYNITVVVEKADATFDIKVALEDRTLDTTETSRLLFENAGYLAAGESKKHDLMFSVLEWGDFTKNVPGLASRTETLKFQVFVDVVQVD